MAEIPFASVKDVELRWRALEEDEMARCEQLLNDASVIMASAMSSSGIDWESISEDSLLAQSLVVVCCDMVIRAMKAPVDLPAVTQYSQGAVGYSESMTYANPNGDLYLTKSEKNMLGITGAVISTVRPAIHDCEGDLIGW